MNVKILNTSTLALETVGRVALPKTLAINNPYLKNGSTGLVLEFEKNVGDVTNIYTFKGKFPPGLTTWELLSSEIPLSSFNYPLSDWVAASPASVVPVVSVTDSSGVKVDLWIGDSISVRNNKHSATFEVPSRVQKGWLAKQYLTTCADLDHVEWKFRLNWADQTNPNYTTEVQRITLSCKNQFIIAFANQAGIPNPTYNAMTDTWSVDIPFTPQVRDGQGLELRGWILTNPEQYLNASNFNANIQARMENLNAIKNGVWKYGGVGAVYAVFDQLNMYNDWFNRHLPSSVDWNGILESNTLTQGNLLGYRSRGCTNTPGQSGSQEDFGADKGFEATVAGDPGWIAIAMGCQTDGFRYYNIHRADGSRVTPSTNPSRLTWSMETFDPVTSDTLGKTRWGWRNPGNGWMGYDNQHRSQNNTLTYYALTGDDLTGDILRNAIEADLQQTRNLDLASREVGRTFLTWARIHKLTLDPRLRTFIERKIVEFSQSWRGRLIPQDREVFVNEVIKDIRSGILNPATGNYEEAWIPYQHAQMISGIYSLLQDFNTYITQQAREILVEILTKLCTTFVKYGFLHQGNSYYPIIFSRYRTGLGSGEIIGAAIAPEEGMPLDPSAYSLDSWQIKLDITNNGWWDWVCPALSVAKTLNIPQELKDKCNAILNYAYPVGVRDIQSLSWFPLIP